MLAMLVRFQAIKSELIDERRTAVVVGIMCNAE